LKPQEPVAYDAGNVSAFIVNAQKEADEAFRRHQEQAAETGRPQKYGAAMADEDQGEAAGGDAAQPGQDTAPPDAQGVEPERQGLEEGMPDPTKAQTREEAEAQANDHIGKTHGAEKMVASHHGHLH